METWYKIDESFPNQKFKLNDYKIIQTKRVSRTVLTLESIVLDFTMKNRSTRLHNWHSQNGKYCLDLLSKY